jgi:tetraacyldisaccharide 4'-kinase
MTPSGFRELVSGRRHGLAASLARFALGFIEPPYTLAVQWRNRRYDQGRAIVQRVPVPVVSVGNLTLGGTGKTPMVQWIAGWLRQRSARVAIVSRGYGVRSGSVNDEALELQQRLPDVPHVQNPDRVCAARQAIDAFACQVIVLDDAFQHRRIARDLDIVLLDALEPFGFDHVFPRGTLREPATGLRRAQVVALSRGELLPPAEKERIRQRAQRLAPDALWLETTHAAQTLVSADGSQTPLGWLSGKPVAALCGIGNPAGFRHTLAACGYPVAGFREFPDHHPYTPADVETLAAWVRALGVAAAVCTCKDLVKLGGRTELGGVPLWALSIGLEFRAGQAEFEGRLAALLLK